jgi:hypothetical protein
MKHPLFTNLNMNTVMLLIKHTFAFITLKKLQILYKEGDDAPLTFIPIYGQLKVWSAKNGQFGLIKLGATSGEESLVERVFTHRHDACYAETDSSIIVINKHAWLELKQARKNDANMQRDMRVMEEVFRKNNAIKKRWRNGIISSNRSAALLS